MTLAATLEQIREGAKQRIPEEKRAIMQQATEELRNSGILERPLRPGERIPPFNLPDSTGEHLNSEDLLARGSLVMTFYRGVW